MSCVYPFSLSGLILTILELCCATGVGVLFGRKFDKLFKRHYNQLQKSMVVGCLLLFILVFGVHKNSILEYSTYSMSFLLIRTLLLLFCISMFLVGWMRTAWLMGCITCVYDATHLLATDIFLTIPFGRATFSIQDITIDVLILAAMVGCLTHDIVCRHYAKDDDGSSSSWS